MRGIVRGDCEGGGGRGEGGKALSKGSSQVRSQLMLKPHAVMFVFVLRNHLLLLLNFQPSNPMLRNLLTF